ncbi:SDR family oxidoreductase [Caulobacter soli]|uniref:SDR family oxidoreductase n=1 Tax=Caulobacter soli TaxID=2708539 RepID=UPI0013E9D599|nr:SDR family oxidoreductase [Caulobacter soli]
MKIVVIGGTGLIGSSVVANLARLGHEAVAAAPNTGVNTLTGEGLAEALVGADIVVDVANSPVFDAAPALDFFLTSGRNLMAAGQAAGVKHHIALSVVGTERLQDSGYFRAKLVQEALIRASTLPYTILRSTQFFPFVAGIVQAGLVGDEVHVSPALVQPIAASDVAAALTNVVLGQPVNGIVEVAGPAAFGLDKFVARYLEAKGDTRKVVSDPKASYFGVELEARSLTPGDHPTLGLTTFEDWLSDNVPTAV